MLIGTVLVLVLVIVGYSYTDPLVDFVSRIADEVASWEWVQKAVGVEE